MEQRAVQEGEDNEGTQREGRDYELERAHAGEREQVRGADTKGGN